MHLTQIMEPVRLLFLRTVTAPTPMQNFKYLVPSNNVIARMRTGQSIIYSQLTFRSSDRIKEGNEVKTTTELIFLTVWATAVANKKRKQNSGEDGRKNWKLVSKNFHFVQRQICWIVCCDRLAEGSVAPLLHISRWFVSIGKVSASSIFIRSFLLHVSAASSQSFSCSVFFVFAWKYLGRFGEKVGIASGVSSERSLFKSLAAQVTK